MPTQRRFSSSQVSLAMWGKRLSRLALPLALSALLLWVASPLLAGRQRGGISPQLNKKMLMLRNQKICRDHLQWLGIAMTSYADDNDGHLPALGSFEKFHKQILAYRKVPGGSLICPFSDKDYNANKNLAGKKRKDIKNPSKTLLLWSAAMADGTYMVLDANGQVRRVTGGELGSMKHASGL